MNYIYVQLLLIVYILLYACRIAFHHPCQSRLCRQEVSDLKLAVRSLLAHKNLKWSMSGSGSGGYCQKEDNPLIYFLYMLFYVFIFSGIHHNDDNNHIYSTISLRCIEVLCCSYVLPVSSNSAVGHIVSKSKENF